MNNKLERVIKNVRNSVIKHSPEILTGIGIAGTVGAVVLSVNITPKAIIKIQNAESNKGNKLSNKEIIKLCWKDYLPVVALEIASISCIIGGNRINLKRNAALGAAYAISEKTLLKYKDKVIETIGEKEEQKIMDKIHEDDVKNDPPKNNTIIVTSNGNTLFKDEISGRYFRSDMNSINKIINELNEKINHQDYVSLNELYSGYGLDPLRDGDLIGWNITNGIIKLTLSTCLVDNNEPCIVLDYEKLPTHGFNTWG